MALFVMAGCARTGTGRPSQSATSGKGPLDGDGFAAFSACGKHGHSLLPGPRPHKESATPQMVILSYGNTSAGAMDPGRLSIRLSIAAGSGQPLTLERPLGKRGLSVEVEGPDGVVLAAHGIPAKVTAVLTGGELTAGARPLDVELVLPAASVCSGHDLEDVVPNSAAPGEGSSTLTVSVRDPAISRHRAAHGHDASSDLLIASWPPDQAAAADGIGTGTAARVTTLFAS